MQVRLGMTDKDVVERFAAIMGCGMMRTRTNGAIEANGWKPLYEWYVYESATVREVIELLSPYMGARRRAKAEEVLRAGAHIRPYGEKRTECPQGHPLSGENLITEPYVRHGESFIARRCRTCRREKDRARTRKRLDIKPENYRIT